MFSTKIKIIAGGLLSVVALLALFAMFFLNVTSTRGESYLCAQIPRLNFEGKLEVISDTLVKARSGFLKENSKFAGIFQPLKSAEEGWEFFKVKTCVSLLEKTRRYKLEQAKALSPSAGGGLGSNLWGFVLESMVVVLIAVNTPFAWGLMIFTFLIGVWLMRTSKNKIAPSQIAAP